MTANPTAPPEPDRVPADLVASLRRRDQRRRALDYVRGLLDTPGRKSIRRMAATVAPDGDPDQVAATEQKLHHFVCDSTWDWVPVRRALSDHVAGPRDDDRPRAWVVRRSVLPRTSNRPVGSCRRYQPGLGRTVTAQIATGLWAAGADGAVPVDWVLHLPESGDSLEQDLATAARGARDDRPVVADVRDLDVASTVAAVTGPDGAVPPMVLRVPEDLVLGADDAAPGRGSPPRPAAALLRGVHRRRTRLVRRTGRPTAVGETEVVVPRAPGAPSTGRRMRLVGAGPDGPTWPSQTWLTTLTDLPAIDVAGLGRLSLVVERDAVEIGGPVGLGDFIGRSYEGWHRHMTLASLAHGARVDERRRSVARRPVAAAPAGPAAPQARAG
jgi:hypothetical protein